MYPKQVWPAAVWPAAIWPGAGGLPGPPAAPFPSFLASIELAEDDDPFGIDPRRTTVELT